MMETTLTLDDLRDILALATRSVQYVDRGYAWAVEAVVKLRREVNRLEKDNAHSNV